MSLRRRALWILLAAKALGGIGVGWDIRWHIVIGRDSFWIAPHVMTYTGVALTALVSFGVLAWGAWRRSGHELTIAGLTGTRGWHLAWWGIALTIIAAPIDDLWHRLFGIDVTLWSPPHLLGLAGAQINSIACLLIAHECWPRGERARTVAILGGGLLLFAGFQTGIDPGVRTAFLHGGVRFFTWAILGALFLTFTLLLAARLSENRAMPATIAVAAVVLQLVVIAVGDVGFAVLQPEPAVAEAIAGDAGSPIAVAHEIARRNGTTPGRAFATRVFPVLPALIMAIIGARRRPLAAGVGFALALYAVNGVMYARSPALHHAIPGGAEAAIALVVTVIAAAAAAWLALGFERRVGEPLRATAPPTLAVTRGA